MTFDEKTDSPLEAHYLNNLIQEYRHTHKKGLNKREGDRVAMKILSKGILTLIPCLVGFLMKLCMA